MRDEVTRVESGHAYRVRGLEAKTGTISGAASEMEMLIADRIAAAETALEHWEGVHAVTFATEVNSVLAKMAAVLVGLRDALNVIASFADGGGPSWRYDRDTDAALASGRLDFTIVPGTASARTEDLRSYVTLAAEQDLRVPVIARLVNLYDVTADVTYDRPLNAAEHQQALDQGGDLGLLALATVPVTEDIDPSTLVPLPVTAYGDAVSMVGASGGVNEFTLQVATAFDTSDQATLTRLAVGTGVHVVQLRWIRADPTRWRSLSPAEQMSLIQAFPQELGTLNGLPTEARHLANRRLLRELRSELEWRAAELSQQIDELTLVAGATRGSALHRPHQEELRHIQDMLSGIVAIEQRLAPAPNRPVAYLLGISTDLNGRAIVAIGNPDEADNVAVYVPGMANTLGNIGGDIERSDTMVADATALVPGTVTSVVMWQDYDCPPDVIAATDPRPAIEAAPRLREHMQGLATSHVGDEKARRVLIGHSYGTLPIGYAAPKGTPIEADAAVLVASPGVGVDHVSKLSFPAGGVYATTARNDIIRYSDDEWANVHGVQPVMSSFGAQPFASDPGTKWPVIGRSFPAHSEYWNDDNPARARMAEIITDTPLTPSDPVTTIPPTR